MRQDSSLVITVVEQGHYSYKVDVFRCAAGAPGLLFGHYNYRVGSLQL